MFDISKAREDAIKYRAMYAIEGNSATNYISDYVLPLIDDLANEKRRADTAIKILQTIDWVGSGAKGRIEDAIGVLLGIPLEENAEVSND